MSKYKKCKECTGCSIKELCLIKYNIELVNRCPCKNCLVKMICKKMCHSRTYLYDTLTSEERSLLAKINVYESKRSYKMIDQQENTYGKYKYRI